MSVFCFESPLFTNTFDAQRKENIIILIEQYPSEMLVFANYLHEFQHLNPQHVTTALHSVLDRVSKLQQRFGGKPLKKVKH